MQIKLEKGVVHQEMYILSSPLQFPFLLPLTCLCVDIFCIAQIYGRHSIFCTMFYFYLLLYFALHMAHHMPSVITWPASVLHPNTE